MSLSPRDCYFETHVLTAPPAKLRLLLVEAAIRALQQTQEHWAAGQIEAAGDCVIRARDIFSELMSPLAQDQSPLARQTLAIYVFLCRSLAEAAAARDLGKLHDMIKVLDEERRTWQAVCEQAAGSTSVPAVRADALPSQGPPRMAAMPRVPMAPPLRFTCDA
jgi:flagellar protein FliS